MKILVVTSSLWFGGAQVAVLEFLNFLREKVEIRIVTCKKVDPNFLTVATSIGLKVYQVNCVTIKSYPHVAIGQVKNLINWADVVWISDVEYLTAPQIKKIKRVPVVAHIHSYALVCPHWNAAYGLREICRERCSAWRIVRCKQVINRELAKIRLLDGFRGGVYWLLDFGKGPLDYYRWRGVMDRVVDSIDFFIAVSRATRDITVFHLPEIGDRLEVVYNPVAYRPWRYVSSLSKRRGNYIFYAGGAHVHKGPHILLKAFKLVRERGVDLKLYMTGTAGTWVEALARRLGVDRGVEFLGKLPEEEYFRLMAGARVTVMPSVWPEPFGIVAVESISLGVPVVGSSMGGLPEIIGRYGVTTLPQPESIADAILRVIDAPYSVNEMRRYANDRFGEANVERFLSLLDSLINRSE